MPEENNDKSADVFSGIDGIATSGVSLLRGAWKILKFRKLEDFPAYGKEKPAVPEEWKILHHEYNHNDIKKVAQLTLSEVNSPSRIVLYALGWNSTPAEKRNVIDGFNEAGATVIALPLVEAGKSMGTMDENIERIRGLVFDKNSTLHKYNRKNLPIHIVTHSAGSNAYMHAVGRAAENLGEVNNIVGAYHTAPFIDAANASIKHHPVKSIIYTFFHAARHKDDYVGISLADKLYYMAHGLTKRLVTENPTSRPTHGQNLELMNYGRALHPLTIDMEASDLLHDIPRETFLYCVEDDFSGHEAIIDLAETRGTPKEKVIAVSGGHSILEEPQNRAHIISIMEMHEEEHFLYKSRPRMTRDADCNLIKHLSELLDFPESLFDEDFSTSLKQKTEHDVNHAPSNS